MCLAYFAIQQHKDYPLIIATNRDEFYARPSHAMHWWEKPELLAGKDEQAGGTWLAIDRQANFAMVTNYREIAISVGEKSRGNLALEFLSKPCSNEQFTHQLDSSLYAGFNLVVGNLREQRLSHISNRSSAITHLQTGLHGLSNALLNTPWPKVESGKAAMQELCLQDFDIERWFALLADQQQAPDKQLPQTGIDIELERLLSSRFIKSKDYGTRCSTIITVDNFGNTQVFERSFNSLGQTTNQQEYFI